MTARARSAAQSGGEPLRAGGYPPATAGGTAAAKLFGRILRGICGLNEGMGIAMSLVDLVDGMDLVDWVDGMALVDCVDGMDVMAVADKGGSVEIGLHD